MSRCFAFPPPGYEKKATVNDPDLLKKIEKKHKKEKDKEKKEIKGKKDKERSDEKHKEKKDKKEKHRDKKKKERDKDKDKCSNSDKKRPGKLEHDGEKTSNDETFPGKSEVLNGEKFSQKEKDKDRSSYAVDKKVAGKLSGYSAEKLCQNSYLAGDIKDSKLLQGLGKRVKDGDRTTGNWLVEKFAGTERKRDEDIVRLVARAADSLDEGKEKKDKKGDDRKLDEQGVRDEPKFWGNVTVQTRAEGMPRSLEKDGQGRTEGKEKTKLKEGDDRRGDKCKHKDREQNDQGKDKEKKKEKENMKSEHKSIENDKLKDSNNYYLIGIHNMKTLQPPKDTDKNAISEENLRKRKELATNGFCHVNDIKPNKLSRPSSSLHPLMRTNGVPRPTASSHPVTETNKLLRPTSSSHSLMGNGRISEHGQTCVLATCDGHGAARNLKANSTECKVNGIIESQPLSVSTAKPQFMTAHADQIVEATMKPPHPDTKYLSQVLSVPKVEECSDFDDQEWLFRSSGPHLKKPELGSLRNDELPHVWAESMRIVSADVCALPFVIPY